jgi:hypothetical protein
MLFRLNSMANGANTPGNVTESVSFTQVVILDRGDVIFTLLCLFRRRGPCSGQRHRTPAGTCGGQMTRKRREVEIALAEALGTWKLTALTFPQHNGLSRATVLGNVVISGAKNTPSCRAPQLSRISIVRSRAFLGEGLRISMNTFNGIWGPTSHR